MAWTAPSTVVVGQVATASLWNTQVRDNFLETGPALVTTKGDILVAAAANNLDRLAVGANERQPVADSAEVTGIRWTARHLWFKGADIASAATLTPGTDGNYFHVTGTVGITTIASLQAGAVMEFEFDAALTITHNATSLILQGGVNLTTAAGDIVAFISEGAGNWRELFRRLARSTADISARVSKSADQSIPNNTATALTFDTEQFDTDAIHDNVTNNSRLTCNTAGKYIIVGSVRWASNAVGTRIAQIRLNGVTLLASLQLDESDAVEITQQVITTIESLAVADYVELLGIQVSGVALDAIGGNRAFTSFSMIRVTG